MTPNQHHHHHHMTEPLLSTTTTTTEHDDDDEDARPNVATHPSNTATTTIMEESSNNVVATTTVSTSDAASPPTPTTNGTWRNNILAFSSTTHCWATLFIPLLILCTHVLFIYGQTSDMWSLLLHSNVNVQYQATTYETKFTLDALHIPRSDHYQVPDEVRIVRTFTYVYAMQELWHAKHMPGLFLPRLAAAGLFLFSGIWPHLKLILLNLTWFTPYTNRPRRQRTLSYLSVLGKWSLVDVLVVCVMVGVLHLRYTFDLPHVMEMVQSHLPNIVTLVHTLYNDEELCSMALKYSCANAKRVDHIVDCQACRNIVSTWFRHPDSVRDILRGIDTSGGGEVQLSVVGLHGIYAFCGAVIASILLSFAVDYYDFQSRSSSNSGAVDHAASSIHSPDVTTHPHSTLPTETTNTVEEDCDQDDAILNQLLLAAENGGGNVHPSSRFHRRHDDHGRIDTRSMADRDFDRTIRIENHRTTHLVWQGISWMTMMVVIAATFAITMERRVYGAIPMLLQETLDVVWTKQYNFIWLAYTTALAGKWDYLLMGTFVWFVIAGPILRSLLCVIASRYNETSTMTDAAIDALYRTKRHLSTWIDFIGAFCAWEVFAVAVLMVDLLMPSITSTILLDPRCAQIISTHTNGTNTDTDKKNSNCFEVEFDIRKNTFWMVITGGVVLLLVSQNIRNNLNKTER